jgi:hypothetical protein
VSVCEREDGKYRFRPLVTSLQFGNMTGASIAENTAGDPTLQRGQSKDEDNAHLLWFDQILVGLRYLFIISNYRSF